MRKKECAQNFSIYFQNYLFLFKYNFKFQKCFSFHLHQFAITAVENLPEDLNRVYNTNLGLMPFYSSSKKFKKQFN